VYIIKGKHSRTNALPKSADAKYASLKMMLFTNLGEKVTLDGRKY